MEFVKPNPRIKTVFDLNPWFFSKGYGEYMKFLHELNDAVRGVRTTDDIMCSDAVIAVVNLLETVQRISSETPLEPTQDQRFGNKAFRIFYETLTKNAKTLILDALPAVEAAAVELLSYFIDSFGNATRIDYGSGHEANFLIWLLCLRKLGIFQEENFPALVLRVFNQYLRVCRFVQTKFHMEPAGSRGVHAIDDFQFAPFIFGSSQLTKTGPFYEHSNQLWNISAVATWNKVNSGMFKMYEGEVLKKFPVVQHFMFGSLFSFERREHAEEDLSSDQNPMNPPVIPISQEVVSFPHGARVETGRFGEKPDDTKSEHAPPPMFDP